MSNTLPTQTKSPQSKGIEHERRWIGFLDDKLGQSPKQSGSFDALMKIDTSRKELGDPMKVGIGNPYSDIEVCQKRREALLRSYTVAENLATDIIYKKVPQDQLQTVRTELEQSLEEFKNSFNEDVNLAIPVDLQKALDAEKTLQSKLEDAISKLPVGMVEFELRVNALKKSQKFEQVKKHKVGVENELNKVETFGKNNQFTKGIEELTKLEQQIDDDYESNLEGKNRANQLRMKLDDLRKTVVNPYLEAKNKDQNVEAYLFVLLDDANELIVESAEKDNANDFDQALEKIKILVSLTKTDSNSAKQQSAFLAAYADIKRDYPGAIKCEDGKKFEPRFNTIDEYFTKKEYTEQSAREAQGLATNLNETLEKAIVAWKKKQTEAQSLLRHAQTVSAANQGPSEIELLGHLEKKQADLRSEAQKQLEANANDGLNRYANALGKAKERDYVGAEEEVGEAITILQKLKNDSDEALKTIRSITSGEKERRAKLFETDLGEVDKKGFVRFDETAREVLMSESLTVGQDGMFELSERANEIIKLQLEMLKQWRDLTAKGIDPVTAGEKVFVDIPLEYWPAEAVRVVAMFRKAEGEFIEEQEAKELEAEVREGALKKSANRIDDILNHELVELGREVAGKSSSIVTDVLKDKFTKQFTEQFPNKTNKEIEELVSNKLKTDDIGKMADGFGKAAGSLSALKNVIGVGKSGFEVNKKRGEIETLTQQVENGDESPVKLRMAEFERNRAIWQIINQSADAILGVAGMAKEIPGINIITGGKDLALAVVEAARYFTMLREASNLKKSAQYDPETMMNLALAEEASRAGLLGAQKSFDAAEALIQIIAGGLELGGITSAAGFALKGTQHVLHYGQKGYFQVKEWRKASELKEALAKARSKPVDIEAIEHVFSHSPKFARFSLAYGALNGDSWARRWVLGRGLTDNDLNNVNTSTLIVREYLNVTFQGIMGETEEDRERDETFSEKFSRTKKVEPPYVGIWDASNFLLDVSAWDKNVKGALGDKLLRENSHHDQIRNNIDKYQKSLTEFTSKEEVFEKAYQEFESAVNNTSTDKEELNNKTTSATKALDAAVKAANEASFWLTEIDDLCKNYKPRTINKTSEHVAMARYVTSLAGNASRSNSIFREFLQSVSTKSLALKAGVTDPKKLMEKARENFNQEMGNYNILVDKYKLDAAKIQTEHWDRHQFTNPITKKKATLRDVIDTTLMQIKLKDDKIGGKLLDVLVLSEADFYRDNQIMVSYASVLTLNKEFSQELELAKTKGRKKEKIEQKWKEKIRSLCKEHADKAIRRFEERLVEIVSQAYFESEAYQNLDPSKKFTAKSPQELDRKIWQENKARAVEADWKEQSSGFGDALDKWIEADRKWKIAPASQYLMADWRSAHGMLGEAIRKIPVDTVTGLKMQGMIDYKKELLKKHDQVKSDFEDDCRQAKPDGEDTGTGWKPTDPELEKWPINREGWETIFTLCKHKGWDPPRWSESLGGHAFGAVGNALDELNAIKKQKPASKEEIKAKEKLTKAVAHLKKNISKWEPGGTKDNKKIKFAGMASFQDKVVQRLGDIDGLISAHAKGWS